MSNQSLTASPTLNAVTGTSGNDTLVGSSGNDILSGLAGHDVLYGGTGDDTLYAGATDYTDTSSNTLYGEDGNDTLYGADYGDTLNGGKGNDVLYGFAGDDKLNDGEGTNQLVGGDGNDTFSIYSASSADSSTLTGGTGSDRFILKAGNLSSLIITDFTTGNGGDILDVSQLLDASVGYTSGNPFTNNYLRLTLSGSDTLLQWNSSGSTTAAHWQTVATLKNTNLASIPVENIIPATQSTGSPISGSISSETVDGSVAADSLQGLDGNDTLYGFGGDDTLEGDNGFDQLYGGQGNDTLYGGNSSYSDTSFNLIYGEDGNDILYGSNYTEFGDTLDGGNGNDTLYAAAGDDSLYDGYGINTLFGGDGNDSLYINSNNIADSSTLTGGAGQDKYVLNPNNLSNIIVTDFTTGSGGDLIDVSQLSTGLLRLMQSGANALLQWDSASNGTWKTVLTLQNTNIINTPLTAQNFSSNTVPTTLNFAPTLTGTAVSLAAGTEDIAYTVSTSSLLQGWTDNESSNLSIVNLSADHGSVTNNNNGTWTITPASNYNGSVTLSYAVSDGVNNVSSSSSFNLAAVNDAPTLTGTAVSLAAGSEDVAYTVSASSLLQGWSDVENNSLSIINLSTDHGSVTNNNNGTWTITPASNYNGSVTLSYAVNDGVNNVSSSSSFNLAAVNDAPTLTGAAVSLAAGSEDVAYTVSASSLLQGWSDVENNSLSIINLAADHGSVTDNHDGSWTITPASNYNGSVTLTYAVSDGVNNVSSSSSFNLTAVNDAPTAANATLSSTSLASIVLSASNFGFSDVDGDSLQSVTITSLPSTGSLKLNGSAVSNNQSISIADINAGNLRFNPISLSTNLGFQVSDGSALSAASNTLTLNSTLSNDQVLNSNISPIQAHGLLNQIITPSGSFSIASNTFADANSDTLTYTATYNGGALPSTLVFDGSTFTATNMAVGTYNIIVNANDGSGAVSADQFTIAVKTAVTNTTKGVYVGTSSAELFSGSSASKGDSMKGLGGDDAYVVNSTRDKITETTSGGTGDEVLSSISYKLGNNLENLTLTGSASANLKATGNNAVNRLTGDDGNNTLDGGKGVDTYIGGKGNDTYLLDSLSETSIKEYSGSGEGTDSIQLKVNTNGNYTIAAYVENLSITGTGVINITGNAQDNVITGNAKANTVDGSSGDDTLYGKLGNDTLTGGDGSDIFVFDTKLGKTNIDTITDFTSGTDSIALNHLIFSKLTGGANLSDNFITVSSGSQALDSNDYLIYNSTDGKLYYDSNGSAKNGLVQIAVIGSHPTLAYSDFDII